mmetsp:Transcript_38816/g.70488  ORF Transcript_38816/g.70488 Transcript_38816/m.70488 type:complete len:210 (-) Transcript_38816:860-1489(-)
MALVHDHDVPRPRLVFLFRHGRRLRRRRLFSLARAVVVTAAALVFPLARLRRSGRQGRESCGANLVSTSAHEVIRDKQHAALADHASQCRFPLLGCAVHHVDGKPRVRRPCGELSAPLLQQGHGHNNQKPGALVCKLEASQESCSLDGLAQAHFVSQDASESLVVEIPHPGHALALVCVEAVIHRPGQLHVIPGYLQRADVRGHCPGAR